MDRISRPWTPWGPPAPKESRGVRCDSFFHNARGFEAHLDLAQLCINLKARKAFQFKLNRISLLRNDNAMPSTHFSLKMKS